MLKPLTDTRTVLMQIFIEFVNSIIIYNNSHLSIDIFQLRDLGLKLSVVPRKLMLAGEQHQSLTLCMTTLYMKKVNYSHWKQRLMVMTYLHMKNGKSLYNKTNRLYKRLHILINVPIILYHTICVKHIKT